jgi:hypothetical protein
MNGPGTLSSRTAIQNDFDTQDSSAPSSATGLCDTKAPPAAADQAEPSHINRFSYWSLAMQNRAVGQETVSAIPSLQAVFGSMFLGPDHEEPFQLRA